MPGLFDLPATQDVPDPGASSNPYLMALGQFLGGIGRTAYNAAKLPGDVYRGNVQVGTPQYNQRAFDLASMMVGTPGGAGGLGSGIRAYHGSPYDFDRFDMSKIGSGEGAQAYGHGLYFAENPATAEQYRKQLANTSSTAQFYLDRNGGNTEKALAEFDKNVGDYAKNGPPLSNWENSQNDRIRNQINRGGGGHSYEVSINADPEHFLDWDKPLSEQSPQVKNALGNVPWAQEYLKSKNLTGGQIAPQTAEGMSQLRSAGIPGIKYLDQGSRNTLFAKDFEARQPYYYEGNKSWYATTKQRGGPNYQEHGPFASQQEANNFIAKEPWQTRNYVVLNDNLISILRKYGLVPGAAIPPTIGSMMGLQGQPQGQ